MRKRQSESNYRLQDGLFAGQAPVQVDSRHNLSAPQLGSRTGAPHSNRLTSPWATEHLGNAMVALILSIFSSFLSLLHLHHVPAKCCYGRHGHYDCHGTGAAPGGDLVL